MKSLANEVLDQTNTYYDIQELIGRRFEGLRVMLTGMQEIAGAVQYFKREKYHTAVLCLFICSEQSACFQSLKYTQQRFHSI